MEFEGMAFEVRLWMHCLDICMRTDDCSTSGSPMVSGFGDDDSRSGPRVPMRRSTRAASGTALSRRAGALDGGFWRTAGFGREGAGSPRAHSLENRQIRIG